MKQSKIRRTKFRTQYVFRVDYERDYNDEVWMKVGSEPLPTPVNNPDAFYRVVTCINPKPSKVNSGRGLYKTLSKRRLEKRLYQAGLSGAKLKDLSVKIRTNKSFVTVYELTALGWDVKSLYALCGAKVARTVLRLVHKKYIFHDEGSFFFSERARVQVSDWMRTIRKHNSRSVTVTQCFEDFV